MALPLYLAMTAAEFLSEAKLPPKIAWMACHFSSYSTGLSNPPQNLPEGSMIILNDRTPIRGHDPQIILQQLQKIVDTQKASSVLLDFQRPGIDETAYLAKTLVSGMHCSVGVSEEYAQDLDCPIFLPPVPIIETLNSYLSPYSGREIWLDAAPEGEIVRITADGAIAAPLPRTSCTQSTHKDTALHCHYHIAISENDITFTLQRTPDDLGTLLEQAASFGVTQAIGLYQEIRQKNLPA